MKILVIDDSDDSLLATKSMLERSPLVDEVETVNNMDEFSAKLVHPLVDAVLIDVEMENISGFEVAAYLQKAHPQIPYVFLTGHAEWALKGYDYSPIDFLTKPLSFFRLERTLEKIAENIATHREEKNPSCRKIGIMVNQGYVFLSETDILYIERLNRKVHIHQANHSVTVLNDSIKSLEQILNGDRFFRSHQSFLVNLDYIERIRVENGGNVFYLQLRGCQNCVPLSRKAYPELKKCLEAHGICFH